MKLCWVCWGVAIPYSNRFANPARQVEKHFNNPGANIWWWKRFLIVCRNGLGETPYNINPGLQMQKRNYKKLIIISWKIK